jgi:hypothetical protein
LGGIETQPRSKSPTALVAFFQAHFTLNALRQDLFTLIHRQRASFKIPPFQLARTATQHH